MSSDKRYEPTDKKRREASQRGELAKSPLVAQAGVLLSIAAAYPLLWQLYRELSLFMAISLAGGGDFHTKHLLLSAQQHGVSVGIWMIALLFVVSLGTLGLELLQVRFRWVLGTLWQPQRLSLVAGVRQLVSVKSHQSWPLSAVRLVSILSIWTLVVGNVGFEFLIATSRVDSVELDETVWMLTAAVWNCVSRFAILVLAVGLIDWWIAKRLLTNRLRMDREELKRELKDSQGDPNVQSQRKQLHSEILAHQQLENVRTAKVVIID